jgi:GT2 family glycosyltransferase
MSVAVLIVNWNGGKLLRRCLESLRKQSRRPDRIVIVDNASSDGSLQQVSDLLDNVKVIRLQDNTGFARANNVGALAAQGFDALALLNPDAFPDSGWLDALVRAADDHPDFAMFASQMRLAETPDRLDGMGDSYHVSGRAWRNGHGASVSSWPSNDADVFAPCAAAALYRRDAFEDVSGFDENYFCYFEDVDLAFRLRLRGYRCMYVHAAIVHHVSSGMSGYRSDFAVYHGERNMVWTFVKNMPGPLLWRYLPQHLVLNLAALFFYPLRGQGRAVWRAKFDAIRGLPAVLRQRRLVQRCRRVELSVLRRALRHGVTVPYVRRYSSYS